MNGLPLVSDEDCSHTSGRTDADNYANLNSFNAIAIKLWKGLNEVALMVAFHTQRLKGSIGGGFWQSLKEMTEKIFSLLGRSDERENGAAE